MRERGFGQRREVEERRVPWPPIGQHTVTHRDLARGLAPEIHATSHEGERALSRPVRSPRHAPNPALRERAYVVLRRNGLDDGDRERERVLFRSLFAVKRKVLMMVDVLGLGIFDPDDPARVGQRDEKMRRSSQRPLGPYATCAGYDSSSTARRRNRIPCSDKSLHGKASERINPARSRSRANSLSLSLARERADSIARALTSTRILDPSLPFGFG